MTDTVSVVVPGIVQISGSMLVRVPGDTVQSSKASAGAAAIVRLSAAYPRQTAVANATMARILMSSYLPSVLAKATSGRDVAPVAVTLSADHVYAIVKAMQ